MNQDMAGSRAAPDDATAGASLPAGRAGQATQRNAVRPVAWVESPLKHRAQAPRQGSEGAPRPCQARQPARPTERLRCLAGALAPDV